MRGLLPLCLCTLLDIRRKEYLGSLSELYAQRQNVRKKPHRGGSGGMRSFHPVLSQIYIPTYWWCCPFLNVIRRSFSERFSLLCGNSYRRGASHALGLGSLTAFAKITLRLALAPMHDDILGCKVIVAGSNEHNRVHASVQEAGLDMIHPCLPAGIMYRKVPAW